MTWLRNCFETGLFRPFEALFSSGTEIAFDHVTYNVEQHMGFFGNWFGDKTSTALARAATALSPMPSAAGVGAMAVPADALLARPRSTKRAISEPVVRDFTTKPNIDPAALQRIMPRDGECALTVSGLDGVLTVGKDMVMTTDQPIHCQTLRVLGTLEATVCAQRIIIAEGARVMGSVRVNDADVRGEFDGSLQARGSAVFHSTASVSGKVRALELTISKDAKMSGADIKRVVPRVFDDLNPEQISGASFDDGYSSMCITVSQRSALRRR